MDNLVFSNITHRPARTMVSIAGIGIGVLLIIFTVGLAHGMLRERGRREANVGIEIIVRPSGTMGLVGSQPMTLPVTMAEQIAKIQGVRTAIPLGQTFDKSDTGMGIRMIEGIDFGPYTDATHVQLKEGRALGSGEEAIVDSVWAQEHKLTIGSTIKIFDKQYKLVGIYEPPGGGRIKIPLSTLQDQLGSPNKCSTILVACLVPSDQQVVAGRIRAAFPEHQIIFTKDLPELYATGVPALTVFLNVVVGVAATISILVVLLAMYTTVTERTRQIGILKSLGMSRGSIALVILQEAVLVSVLGVAFGVLLAVIFRLVIMHSTTLTIDIEIRWIVISLLVGLLGGSLGALYPAMRAAGQDAVEALSYE